jgi:SHAQKYF class myb-like DNA-binding protein
MRRPYVAHAQYPAAYQKEDDLEDEGDDSGMRAAKRAALEIEWCDAMTEQGFLPVPSRDKLKKMGVWSSDEHERYCAALKLYRYGSWSQIAHHVGSRTERQVSSHAQSIRVKC